MSRRGAGLFSVSTLLASFFGAAMIAGAFAYFNYKFQEYKFVDFSAWTFYQQKRVFIPTQPYYVVIFFSSHTPKSIDQIRKLELNYPILAIDMYQQKIASDEQHIFLRAGTNTLLAFIQRFNLYRTPSLFMIKKTKETLYKQDSMIREIDDYSVLEQKIKE